MRMYTRFILVVAGLVCVPAFAKFRVLTNAQLVDCMSLMGASVGDVQQIDVFKEDKSKINRPPAGLAIISDLPFKSGRRLVFTELSHRTLAKPTSFSMVSEKLNYVDLRSDQYTDYVDNRIQLGHLESTFGTQKVVRSVPPFYLSLYEGKMISIRGRFFAVVRREQRYGLHYVIEDTYLLGELNQDPAEPVITKQFVTMERKGPDSWTLDGEPIARREIQYLGVANLRAPGALDILRKGQTDELTAIEFLGWRSRHTSDPQTLISVDFSPFQRTESH